MERATILLISDDSTISRIWQYALSEINLNTVLCATYDEAVEWRMENTAHLIVVDEYMRDFDGVALIRDLRADTVAPILLLTPSDPVRCLQGYAAGADECVCKPISPDLFLAKIRAWLRHSAMVPLNVLGNLKLGPFELFPLTQEVRVYDRRVALTNLEFRLLRLLMTYADQVVPTQVLMDRVWGYAADAEGGIIKNAVYRLRRKVEPNAASPKHIIAVTGVGYMFTVEPS